MLDSLPRQAICAGAKNGMPPPLAALNRDIHDDWAIALVHAWAVVTDVLSFYQERITNEGYLRTATEYRSILELARSIGYELRPGLAASTHLAFTVLTLKDEPPRRVLIPRGTAVQSIPPQGQLPQTFETSADLEARAEWNALKPANAVDGLLPWDLRIDSTCLRKSSRGGLYVVMQIAMRGAGPSPAGPLGRASSASSRMEPRRTDAVAPSRSVARRCTSTRRPASRAAKPASVAKPLA